MALDRTAILWDVDGTLVNSEPLHETALVQAQRSLGLTPPPDLHRNIVGRDARDVHNWCYEHLGLTLDLHAWLRMKYRTCPDSAADLEPGPGAVELFQRLRGEGCA